MAYKIIHKDYPGISRDVRNRPLSPAFHFSACNPWSDFNMSSAPSLDANFNNALSIEESKHSLKSNSEFRRNALTRYGVPKIGKTFSGFTQIDTSQSPSGRDAIGDILRERQYLGLPVGLVIFTACCFIAYSPNRNDLFRLVPTGTAIPTFLTQLSMKVRETRISTVHTFVSGTNLVISPDIKASFLNTFFDFDYVTSPVGFSQFINFCNWCFGSDGNYISFGIISDSNFSKVLPSLEGGHQCTFCAMNSENFTDSPLEKLIEIRPGNAFANDITVVQLDDAYAVGQRLFKNATNIEAIPTSKEHFAQVVHFSSLTDSLTYRLGRVTNQISNSTPQLQANDRSAASLAAKRALQQATDDSANAFVDAIVSVVRRYANSGFFSRNNT